MANERRPLIAGNWKMNGLRRDGFERAHVLMQLVADAEEEGELSFDLLICPPATLLEMLGDLMMGRAIRLGGQDCHSKASGAHTGDISAQMLKDLKCTHCIVGHSERRTDHKETDAVVKAKAEAAITAGLTAVVCVGETEAERDAGKTNEVVARQIKGSVPAQATAASLVVAYEPVWAIGTGRTPTAAEVQDVHALIRARLVELIGPEQAGRTRLLYGGSVKPANARELLALPDVDGALVGGASLVPEDFWAIAKAAV
jgi:triosephosphate isomerase (TIM)